MSFEDKAEAHWEWIETWLHRVYVDSFVHGYRHGYEDAKAMAKKEAEK